MKYVVMAEILFKTENGVYDSLTVEYSGIRYSDREAALYELASAQARSDAITAYIKEVEQ